MFQPIAWGFLGFTVKYVEKKVILKIQINHWSSCNKNTQCPFCVSSVLVFNMRCSCSDFFSSPYVLYFRADSETASMSSHSHPRNMFTSCDRASRRRSCSTAWSLSECLSPATLSGESLHSFSPSAIWSWELCTR